MSALTSKADIGAAPQYVRLVPRADIEMRVSWVVSRQLRGQKRRAALGSTMLGAPPPVPDTAIGGNFIWFA